MATSFAAQLLRDVIFDQSTTRDTGMQEFNLRRVDANVLAAIADSTPGLLSKKQIQQLEKTRNSNHQVQLYLYEKAPLQAGNQRVRVGAGSAPVANVTPTYFDIIEEGIDMSYVNQSLRQYGSEGADRRRIISEAYRDHFKMQLGLKIKNMYERANAQHLAWLQANIWALAGTADNGSYYPAAAAVANVKQVAAADLNNGQMLTNMKIEADQNYWNDKGMFIIASPTAGKMFQEYRRGLGLVNFAPGEQYDQFKAARDTKMHSTFFGREYISNSITDLAGYQGTFYGIYKGGVGNFNRIFDWHAHPQSQNGVITAGNDMYLEPIKVGKGSAMMPDMPQMNIEVKATMETTDNFAVYGTDEARIDLVNTYSLVTQYGAVRAYDPDVNVSPILRYDLLV